MDALAADVRGVVRERPEGLVGWQGDRQNDYGCAAVPSHARTAPGCRDKRPSGPQESRPCPERRRPSSPSFPRLNIPEAVKVMSVRYPVSVSAVRPATIKQQPEQGHVREGQAWGIFSPRAAKERRCHQGRLGRLCPPHREGNGGSNIRYVIR